MANSMFIFLWITWKSKIKHIDVKLDILYASKNENTDNKGGILLWYEMKVIVILISLFAMYSLFAIENEIMH